MTAMKFRRVLSLGSALAIGLGLLNATPASAATNPLALTIAYDANGSSVVARTGSTVALGPAVLTISVLPDGSFTGTLPLPPSKTSFKAIGFLPTTATVSFVPVGQLAGQIGSTSTGAPSVTSTASYYLKLSNVTIGGLPGFVGNSCQTISPVSITASSPDNQPFDVINGGPLVGRYSIGLFANCGINTALIDLLIPGSGNTIDLQLANGRLVS